MSIELFDRFRQHNEWNKSGGRKGKRLFLDEYDLSEIDSKLIPTEQIYLAECNLSGMRFNNASFYQAELYSCNLIGAIFEGCSFRKATFDECNIRGARFINCQFPRMDSYLSDYQNSVFDACSFEGINLMSCCLNGASLTGVDMSDAYLDKLSIDGTICTGVTNLNKAVHVSVRIDQKLFEGADAARLLAINDRT